MCRCPLQGVALFWLPAGCPAWALCHACSAGGALLRNVTRKWLGSVLFARCKGSVCLCHVLMCLSLAASPCFFVCLCLCLLSVSLLVSLSLLSVSLLVSLSILYVSLCLSPHGFLFPSNSCFTVCQLTLFSLKRSSYLFCVSPISSLLLPHSVVLPLCLSVSPAFFLSSSYFSSFFVVCAEVIGWWLGHRANICL